MGIESQALTKQTYMIDDYLLDTTVVVDYLRDIHNAVIFIESLKTPVISIISVAELYQGARSKRELILIQDILKYFQIIHINEAISQQAIQLLQKYTLSHGLLILDAIIAATAQENKKILISANVKHFVYIPKLTVKNI